MRTYLLTVAALAAPIAFAHPALAAAPPPHKFGDPVVVGDGLTLDPIVEGRLRWEHVDQPATDADAVTLRLRIGGEQKHAKSHLSLLAEAEGTAALGNGYNAFPFAVTSSQRRTAYSVVADPENIELNRLQLQYKGKAVPESCGCRLSLLTKSSLERGGGPSAGWGRGTLVRTRRSVWGPVPLHLRCPKGSLS